MSPAQHPILTEHLSRVQSLICLCNPMPGTGLAPAGHWGSVSHSQVWLPASNGANVKGDEGCNLCPRPGQNAPNREPRGCQGQVCWWAREARTSRPSAQRQDLEVSQGAERSTWLSSVTGGKGHGQDAPGVSPIHKTRRLQSLERMHPDPALTPGREPS